MSKADRRELVAGRPRPQGGISDEAKELARIVHERLLSFRTIRRKDFD
jgi:hypothetical protein